MLHVLILTFAILSSPDVTAADAPTAPLPDAAALAKAREHGRRTVGEAAATVSRRVAPERERLERALEPSVQAAPRFRAPDPSALPPPKAAAVAKARRDIARLLERPEQALEALRGAGSGGETAPIVFVSFSMPEAALRGYLAQAARLGSPVVLRGFVGDSMRETLDRILALLHPDGLPAREEDAKLPREYEGLSLAIDPTLYRRFGIGKVPAVVLTAEPIPPCRPDGCPVPAHVKLAGDAGLPYALALMAREAEDPDLRGLAERFRERLEATP